MADRLMRCPVCKKEFDPASSNALPFCNERCRSIDLGRWLNEEYSMPHMPDPEDDDPGDGDAYRNGNGAP